MITQDEAIAMAREAGWTLAQTMTQEQMLTALCNLVRKQTLEEAADLLNIDAWAKDELRRMAKDDNEEDNQ